MPQNLDDIDPSSGNRRNLIHRLYRRVKNMVLLRLAF